MALTAKQEAVLRWWVNGPATVDDVVAIFGMNATERAARFAEIAALAKETLGPRIAELDAERTKLADIVAE